MTERSTNKHAARVDDELARETEQLTHVSPFALHLDDVEARAELASALRPGAFPADAIALRRVAEGSGAPEWVIELLTHVDPVTRYDTVGALWRAAGGHDDVGNGRGSHAAPG